MRRVSLVLVVAASMLAPHVAAGAQSLDSTMTLANAAEAANDFGRAAQLYERFYNLSGFDPAALGVAAIAAARAGQASIAIQYLRRAVEQGYLNDRFLAYVESDSSLARMVRVRAWADVLADAKRRAAALDQPLRRELLDIAERDQKNRQSIAETMQKFGRASPQGDSAARALERDDAPLLARVREIIRTGGWPGATRVGDDGAHAAWLVIQHAPAEVQRELLPSIRSSIRGGGGRLGDLALLEDRVLVADGRPQMYGTQLKYSAGGGAPTLEPIVDEPCVDRRRATMGLEPIADYLRRMGASYTPPAARCPPGPSRSGSAGSAAIVVHAGQIVPTNFSLAPSTSMIVVASVVADASVTERTVMWCSSDPAIARVDAYGRITGVSNGATTIIAVANADPRIRDSVVVSER